jgi:LPXTG-motif cell wall-anchored protein
MVERKSEIPNKKISEEDWAKRRKRRRWLHIVEGVASVAVFVVAYMLILMPASSLEKTAICGKEEHVHTASCYADASESTGGVGEVSESTDSDMVLVCGKEAHVHDTSCYTQGEVSVTTTETTTQTTTETTTQTEETTETTTTAKKSAAKKAKAADTDDAYRLELHDTGTEDVVSAITVYYKCPDVKPAMTEWAEVTDAVKLHGDDSMKLNLEYEDVELDKLVKSNYKLYYKLPDWINTTDDTVTATMSEADGTLIGTVSTEEGYLVSTFESSWVNNKLEIATTVNGSMGIEITMNPEKITSTTITIGSDTLNVDYQAGVWQSKYATIDIQKSKATYIEQKDGADILQYTLTVSTGSCDMQDVKVVDYYTQVDTKVNVENYIKEYVGITDTKTTITNAVAGLQETSTLSTYTHGAISYADSNLVWNIGDMAANETRTLTYQVKIKSEYTGMQNRNAIVFLNKAELYSMDAKRDTVSSRFDLQADAPVYKGQMSYTPDSDGVGGTITYWIKISANSTNTYTMDNIKIYDFFAFSSFTTDTSVASPYDITVEAKNFALYDGDATSADNLASCIANKKQITLKDGDLTIEKDSNGKFKSFTCYAGDFEPGQVKTLVYSVKVNDSYYVNNNNGSFTLRNRATTYANDKKTNIVPSPNSGNIGGYNYDMTISFGNWEKKYNGEKQTEDTTIDMSSTGKIYQTSGSSIVGESGTTSFDVKYGYYKYEVIVNQYGGVDISAVDLKDALGNGLQYAGYLRVDAYDSLKKEGTLSGSTPPTISESIVQTSWLDIDGQSSFTFEPKQLGFSGAEAYVLTYYVKVAYTGTEQYITAENSFTMSGTGVGTANYVFTGMKVGVSFNVSTNSSCEAEKYQWYYQMPTLDDDSEWSNGTLYWYIKVSGTDIPAGMIWKDVVDSDNHKLVKGASLVGVYAVKTDTIPDTIDSMRGTSAYGKAEGEEIAASNYTVSWNDTDSSLSVTFNKQVTIPTGKDIFIVIKTAILKVPSGDATVYKNKLLQSRNGENFQQVGDTVNQVVSGNEATEKTVADKSNPYFIYDGENFYNPDGSSQLNGTWGNYKDYNKDKSLITQPGTYIEYKLYTCKNGRISGDVVFSDTIPEGLELVYLRNEWYHNDGGSASNPEAYSVEIEELENNPNWTKFAEPNKKDSNATSDKLIYYYNSKTREIRWKLSNVKVYSTSAIIYFQMVMRVVDQDVLLGTKTGSYINTLKVYQDDSTKHQIDESTAGEVVINQKQINKSIDGAITGTKIPFKIVVNEFGEDLVKGTNEITVIDEMGSNLTLDYDSIKIVDKDNHDITESTNVDIAVEMQNGKTILKITIPDKTKATVTYDTRVNAEDGETVDISNVAHWEGYAATTDSEVVQKVTINLSGGASAGGVASLKLTKRDAENILTKLPNATFTMQQAVYDEATGTFTLTGDIHTVTTDSNGVAYFSTDTPNWMKYNTIYCITETQAPTGYIIAQPRYILLAKNNYSADTPSVVEVQRGVSQYEFTALDEPIAYALPQTGGIGTHVFRMWGVAFLAVSIVGGTVAIIKRRRKEREY